MKTEKNLHPILYIDDEEDNLIGFNATFRRDYEIHLATSGHKGLEIMKMHDIHLVITDQRMPQMTGIEFLEKIIPLYPDCIRMVLTGFSDVEAIFQAINKGNVYRHITKPWIKEEIKITMDSALEAYNLKQQNKKIIEDLKEAIQNMEQKAVSRTKQIEQQKIAITDSIHYASRMQSALLPLDEDLDRLLPSYFLLNKPKDIVSGDFYWLSHKDNKVIVVVADCTGHGVPGAFMSILGIAFLNEIIKTAELIIANEILNELRERIIKSLHRMRRKGETRDGMEMALCVIDYGNKKLQYSGAFCPLYFIRNKELNEIKGDYMPIGVHDDEKNSFSNKELLFKEDDIIYLFSDGYVSQIGGPNRKTFRSRKFKQLLIYTHQKPLSEQKEILEKEYEEWRQDVEEIDDIMVMGIRFSKV